MTHDEAWLATMRQLYGEDYVRKLLEKQQEEKEEDDPDTAS